MILSFHPIFNADQNIICAGRKPTPDDSSAIQEADAVILPQGCSQSLYQLACQNCAHVFPNYDARFGYPGKIGQIRLFHENKVNYPASEVFDSVDAFKAIYNGALNTLPFSFPLLFKFNWGGEGESVFLIHTAEQLQKVIQKAGVFEGTEQMGFTIQEFIPNLNRTLRVAVIGQKRISYWRVQKNRDRFHASLAKGAIIDAQADPELQELAISETNAFCKKTKIDLAGFDFLFSDGKEPFFLEINYFFGRRGLGGSEKYYQMLIEEITNWLSRQGLKFGI
jgi:ribosomal protein S6--L-glutamate ligase